VIEFAGQPYIIDCGMGVTRQFVEAGYTLADVHTIVLTHLHSDHCLELGPLLYTIWVSSPKREVRLYGPPGVKHLVKTFFAAMSYDIEMRMADERQKDPSDMFVIEEFEEGAVFEDENVAVSALRVMHPPLTHTYALRFEGKEKSAVFSADTCYFPPLAEFAKDADVLVHEVMHREGTERMCARLKAIKPNLMAHMIAGHTFGDDVGRIATSAGVGHLAVQHFTPSDDPQTGPEDFAALVRQTWDGPLTVGADLTEIEL
jgi:ribonuclease BN (tRNA processing enzyme)